MKDTLFSIRATQAGDLPYLEALFAEDGMPLPSAEGIAAGWAAVNASNEPVGFIRILEVQDEEHPEASGCYVYPVIVFQSWQGYGVGTALIEHAARTHGELRLVACAASRAFYPRCGFEPLPWRQVATIIAQDCELCKDKPSCNPVPYKLVYTQADKQS